MADKWPRDLWLDAIWEDPTLKPNERVVAYAYARYAGKGRTTWCSWAEITRRTGIRSKDAIWRALSGLVGSGWLAEEERPRQHRSAVYRLTVPAGSTPEVRETDRSAVRETDPWTEQGASEVRENVARGPAYGNQRSGKREAIGLIENSEERSDFSSDRGIARSPSGAQPARCHRCNGRGWFASRPGCLEPCTECRSAA